jgi:hypothetical protein
MERELRQTTVADVDGKYVGGSVLRLRAMITEQIRTDVLCRVLELSSERQIPDAMINALLAARLDWREVTLDEMKSLLVDAIRVWRSKGRRWRRGSLCCA